MDAATASLPSHGSGHAAGLEYHPSGGGLETERRGRRRHVWGPIPGDSAAASTTADSSAPRRKRKSRWGNRDDAAPNEEKALMLMPDSIVLSNGIKVVLPPVLTGRSPTGDPEVLSLHQTLLDVTRKLAGPLEVPPEGERSPSPPPIYDAMGIRQNTREVRLKEKLTRERGRLIEQLLMRDPTYKAPTDYRPEKKSKKLIIPQKEHPGYNFIGLIIGPRGATQQRMQAETNTKIAIRGRGSVKEGLTRDAKTAEDDELHVMITGDRQEDVDAAASMVSRLLEPLDEEMNEHKRLQLRELARINGTLKESEFCHVCGDPGHPGHLCPRQQQDIYRLPAQLAVAAEEQYARDVARMNPGDAAAGGEQAFGAFMAELGGVDPRDVPAAPPGHPGLGAPRARPGDDLPDACKLYVGNVPPTAQEHALRALFEPHGLVLHLALPRDGATGVPRGFAFVHFADEAGAQRARQATHGCTLEGSVLNVRPKGEPPMRGGPSGPEGGFSGRRGRFGEDPDAKLYVGSLPPGVEEADLHREFSRFGPVASCRVMADRDTGRKKGFGFVNFADPHAARAALHAMDGYGGFDPTARPISVRVAGGGGGMGGHFGPPGPPMGGFQHPFPPPPPGHFPPPPPGPGSAMPPYPPPPPSGAFPAPPPGQGGYYPPPPGAFGVPYGGAYQGQPAYPGPPPPEADGMPPPPPPPPPPQDEGEAPPPPPPPPAPAPAVESEYEKFMSEMNTFG